MEKLYEIVRKQDYGMAVSNYEFEILKELEIYFGNLKPYYEFNGDKAMRNLLLARDDEMAKKRRDFIMKGLSQLYFGKSHEEHFPLKIGDDVPSDIKDRIMGFIKAVEGFLKNEKGEVDLGKIKFDCIPMFYAIDETSEPKTFRRFRLGKKKSSFQIENSSLEKKSSLWMADNYDWNSYKTVTFTSRPSGSYISRAYNRLCFSTINSNPKERDTGFIFECDTGETRPINLNGESIECPKKYEAFQFMHDTLWEAENSIKEAF